MVMKKIIKSILISAGAILAYFLLSFLLSMVGVLIIMNLPQDMDNVFWTVFLESIFRLFIILFFAAWYLWQKTKKKQKIKYKRVFSGKNILSITGLAVFGQVVTGVIVAIMAIFFRQAALEYEQVVRSFSLETTSPLLMILLVGVLGPIAEEFFFRGVLYENLKQGIEVWGAMIVSALVFGIFHGNLIQGFYAVLAGLLLAYIYEKTGTILASILLHILFNLSSYIVGYINDFFGWIGFPLVGIRYLGFIVLSFIIVIICIRNFAHFRKEEKESEYERISKIE